jgi:hypothetical protein
MADAAALKAAADAAEAAVTQQGDAVRALKASLKSGDATKVGFGGRGGFLTTGWSAADRSMVFRSMGLFASPRSKPPRALCWEETARSYLSTKRQKQESAVKGTERSATK